MLIRRAGRPWLCSLTTSSLGFPLSTKCASRGHRGMDEALQGRERVGQGSGCRKERESGWGTDGGGGAAEQAGLQEGGVTAECGSRPGLGPGPGICVPSFTERWEQWPNNPQEKGTAGRLATGIDAFSKRLLAELLLQDEVFSNQFFPGLHSRPSQPP